MPANGYGRLSNTPGWPELERRLKENFDKWPSMIETFIPPKYRASQAQGFVTVDYMARGDWHTAKCSSFSTAAENLHALVLAFEAVRKADQRGIAGLFAEVASSVAALPDPNSGNPHLRTLGLSGIGHTRAEILSAYRAALKRTHPDHGGTAEEFQRVQAAGKGLGIA